jgi:DHA3 family macrolide efflux protein-like MFS transporter
VSEASGNRQSRNFFLLWLGQAVSMFGSSLTTFTLGVWVFRRTGSATKFSLIAVSATLPLMLVAPFAGVAADRWDRRRVMILANLGAALTSMSLVLAALLAPERLEVWHIYVVVALNAACNALLMPAYQSSVPMLVPRDQLGRANGLFELGDHIARVGAPLLAGVVLAVIKLGGIVLVDFATFLFAISTLLLIHIPRPEASATGRAAGGGSVLRQAAFGWRYIVERPGLLGLLAFFTLLNLLLYVALVLVTPLVLSFASAAELGLVLAVGGAGGILGGILMSAWGGTREKMRVILGLAPVLGLGLLVIGLRPSLALVILGYFAFFLVIPILNASNFAIWQAKVEPDVQGRVLAMRRLIVQASAPIAFLAAGPLADDVFKPLLMPAGPLAGSVGRVIGVGPGRGIGLVFILMGCLLILSSAAAYLFPHLRRVERDLPDALPNRAPAGA